MKNYFNQHLPTISATLNVDIDSIMEKSPCYFVNGANQSPARKLFIDLGGNIGQSILQFLNWKQNEALSYDVVTFEANLEFIPQLVANTLPHQQRFNSLNIIPCAVGCRAGLKLVSFDGWQLAEFGGERYRDRLVPTFQFTEWLLEQAELYQEIILKIDIEGAEYRLLDELIESAAIHFITDLFVEFHGERRGFTTDDTNRLISALYDSKIIPYMWEPSKDSQFVLKHNPSAERARIVPLDNSNANALNFVDTHGYIIEQYTGKNSMQAAKISSIAKF